eukprot:m.389476 g.389476  ORF g.389476 m.389476 type:complete len:55 (+) comp179255_c0_seq1:63-227(+)
MSYLWWSCLITSLSMLECGTQISEISDCSMQTLTTNTSDIDTQAHTHSLAATQD